ncbi:ARPP-1 family domain-containing protein [Chryseolinea lacunae]|uniref:ARG and Rhodanese-Phosphatase-superfamily-associated domain-containing protein n=1 Tax=Chryseolinea lacunae TaxID=2801331 RepID=A0ABS1KWT7_9BACT|nr:DUF6569 family protein [Chryseolinea lacunae]MBL0743839.1 hypothetical protein [Chryseolinea lacunae]
MKNILLVSALLTVVAPATAQYNKINLKLEQPVAASPYKYQYLQLYPVRANAVFQASHKNIGKYVTLREGLKTNKAVITEYNRGEVNTLYIENVSKDTIMVLSGEVVQGGKQDRVIAQDFILYPKSGKKDIAVFCVEHGRWQPKEGESGADAMNFKQYYSFSSNEVRKAAAVDKDQGKVWDKVAETTAKNNANSSTGALTALAKSGTFSKELKKYTDHFTPLLVNEPDVIGVVVVAGDAILGCDMFATHALFAQHYPDLVNAYATQAITTGKPVTVPYEKTKQYLDTIIADEYKQDNEVKKKGTMLKEGGKKVHISTF